MDREHLKRILAVWIRETSDPGLKRAYIHWLKDLEALDDKIRPRGPGEKK